ncbi:MAG: baseplate J/gp47 family protein [Acidobacteriota bacterium]|nr:baseplate J/gp47 family protein [Acidobacteriota bacterium]
MSTILYNSDALAARARNLGALNGIDFATVQLDSASPPAYAIVEAHFYNDQNLDALVAAANTPAGMWALMPISGGERVVGGPLADQVKVISLTHSGTDVLQFKVAPVGDYSVYTLTILEPGFDPVFAALPFRFRPGCFNANCKPLPQYAPAVTQPAIDYLAKDYDSFRHTMIAAMMDRAPNWQASTEAAFDVTLLDLFCAAADELSNYQDRVMQEAYWPTAQKRISFRRHARLMAYYPYEGNQSNTVLALNFPGSTGYSVASGTAACTGAYPPQQDAVTFVVAADAWIDPLFSSVDLYTWSDAIPSLAKGATSADLAFSSAADAANAQSLIASGKIQRLLIQEWLNPATGQAAGADPAKRQIVRLTGAEVKSDPLTGDVLLRVAWSEADALTSSYCFVVNVNGARVPSISCFHGNLLDLVQGAKRTFEYLAPGSPPSPGNYEYQLDAKGAVECRLPPAFPVLWTKTANRGYAPPISSVKVSVTDSAGTATWHEQPDLIHSTGADRDFVVETDENLRSLVRFGDGANGAAVADDATVTISWLSGYGPDGNIGKDVVTGFDATLAPNVALGTCWNPLDVTDGAPPEDPAIIQRMVPEAFLYKQERAVTLADYVARAEEIAGVSRAAAQYAWTGSWRTVRVSIDPEATTTLSTTLRATVEAALDAVHLIGEDVEVRAPEYVPLTIALDICISSDTWIDDVAPVIDQAFSNGYTADGKKAFFHPDQWTFGQALHASQIEGVLAGIRGVEHLVSISMARWWNQSVVSSTVMTMGSSEIVLLSNDPSRMEEGIITFHYQGGRQ